MELNGSENLRELSPADLRGILKYVPQWRKHVFVIALDGAVMEEETFSNLMLELAVLRNLGIRICLVYGIGHQISQLAHSRHLRVSDSRGVGPTDHATLDLAIEAAARTGHLLERGLTQNGLRCIRIHAVRAVDRGIIDGVNQLFTGKVDRIQSDLLLDLMNQELVPVLGPVTFTRDGSERRLNSDSMAADLAIALNASKLIYMLPYAGLTYKGQLRLNADVAEVRELLRTAPETIDAPIRSKAEQAIRTIEGGTPRAHIIDSRIHDGLLMEVFSKVGIGSMIHSNPYSQIRNARRKDAAAIHALTTAAVRDKSLRARSKSSIESDIDEYFVYEIDGSLIGCCRLTQFPRSRTVELASVYVHPAYQGRRIGKALVDFAVEEARRLKKNRMVALTTQTSAFFEDTCGFQQAEAQRLPIALRESLKRSKRNSLILMREI